MTMSENKPAKKVLCLIGTRPEAIKVAPVVLELKKHSNILVRLVSSGQHRELVQSVLTTFGLILDHDCSVMVPNQTLEELTGRLFMSLSALFRQERPDLVLAQGDTTSVLVASMVCFTMKIPFAHLEAGLRSGDLESPFPEEMNRRVSSIVSSLHFAPTEQSRQNLIAEKIKESTIEVTGNTVIDALLYVRDRNPMPPYPAAPGHRQILLTAHRRENFGEPHAQVFRAIKRVLDTNPKVEVLYPVHPNPNVKLAAEKAFQGVDRVRLVPPLEYEDLVATMMSATLILTDSGGIQEEAPALSKPVVILRQETERPEIVTSGAGVLCGTNEDRVFEVTQKFLSDELYYQKHVIGFSPVGDGKASPRVVERIQAYLS